MIADLPELTEHERCSLIITALHQAAAAGQQTTLARIHYSWLARAADKIEQLAKEVDRLKDENGVIREQCQNMLDMMVR